LLSANDVIVIDGADVSANLGTLHPFGGNTVLGMTLGGVQNGSYIVNLGTSGETAILMEGAGHQQIAAASGVAETFAVGNTSLGGSTISNLEVNDRVDVNTDGKTQLTTQVGSASLVNAAGEWSFGSDALTWWDAGHAAAETLTLQFGAGATGLELQSNGHNFRVV
jgi:hypothetical protein